MLEEGGKSRSVIRTSVGSRSGQLVDWRGKKGRRGYGLGGVPQRGELRRLEVVSAHKVAEVESVVSELCETRARVSCCRRRRGRSCVGGRRRGDRSDEGRRTREGLGWVGEDEASSAHRTKPKERQKAGAHTFLAAAKDELASIAASKMVKDG